jgi:hydroxymethylbilane synthase
LLVLTGIVAGLDGTTVLRARVAGRPAEAAALGAAAAGDLMARGAKALLDASHGG